MKKTKTILKLIISGYYGFKNAGDEAILASMVKNIRAKSPQIDMTVLSANPLETSCSYHVKAIHRMKLFQIIKCITNADLFISGGGGLLQDSTGRGLSILYYLGLILMAKIARIPVMVYAQGIGPVKNTFNHLLIRWIFNQIDLITLRDSQSKELLRKIGINKPAMYVNADPSFLLEKNNFNEILADIPTLKKLFCGDNQPIVGISVRRCKGNNDDLKRKFVRISNDLIRKYKAKIIFIPFHAGEDISFSKEIVELIEKRDQTYLLENNIKPETLITIISRLSFMLGIRLHSIMFSCLMQVPFIALNYDPKIKNFVSNLELSELLIDLEDLSLKSIQKRVEYIMENNKEIRKLLSVQVQLLKEKANSNNDLLFQLLESGKETLFLND